MSIILQDDKMLNMSCRDLIPTQKYFLNWLFAMLDGVDTEKICKGKIMCFKQQQAYKCCMLDLMHSKKAYVLLF